MGSSRNRAILFPLLALGAFGPLGCGVSQQDEALREGDETHSFVTLPPLERIEKQIQGFVTQLRSDSIEQRRAGAEALQQLSDEDYRRVRSATNDLVLALGDGDEDVRKHAMWALRNGLKETLPALEASLTHDDPVVRSGAADAIGRMAENGSNAEAALRELLDDDSPSVRGRAAWALGSIGGCEPPTIERLIGLIDSDVAEDRSAALHALARLPFYLEDDAPIRRVKPQALDCLHDEDAKVRWSAHFFLDNLKLTPEEQIPLLAQGLLDDDERIMQFVSLKIQELAPLADLTIAVPGLCRIVQLKNRAAPDACAALRDIGRHAASAADVLTEALRGEPQLASVAAAALWTTNGRTKESLPVLKKLLGDRDSGPAACNAVCFLGPVANELLPELLNAAGESPELRWAASDAVSAVASEDPRTIQTLIIALGHQEKSVRELAEETLHEIGEATNPQLLKAVVDLPDSRKGAATILATRVEESGDLAKQFVRLLKHEDLLVRVNCALALAFYTEREEATPVLIESLKHVKDAELRIQIEDALGDLE